VKQGKRDELKTLWDRFVVVLGVVSLAVVVYAFATNWSKGGTTPSAPPAPDRWFVHETIPDGEGGEWDYTRAGPFEHEWQCVRAREEMESRDAHRELSCDQAPADTVIQP
jgi:hypothetical protein